jgi:hypothetical protein
MCGMRLAVWLVALIALTACASTPPARPAPAPPAPLLSAEAPPALVPRIDLYAADEALQDVLSGRLEYVGTGRWPGIERSYTCVFRNARVLVVHAYCTQTEAPAMRIDVYSPGRGYTRLYAESNGPISIRDRALYSSFLASSEPPPSVGAPVGDLALSMSFDELRRYEQKRYDAYLPACYAGEQRAQRVQGCLGPLAAHVDDWVAENHEFLTRGSGDWYRVVHMMRTLAMRHGKDPH